ncbi:MAG: hypothetical protein AAF512_20130, partial [Pseudomonadota bacterium]
MPPHGAKIYYHTGLRAPTFSASIDTFSSPKNLFNVLAVFTIFILSSTYENPANAYEQKAVSDFHLELFLDARLVYADNARSWLDEELGKARYGGDSLGDRRIYGQLAEASALASAKFGKSWFGHAHVKYDDEQDRALDIVEAFLSYRPVPTSEYRFKALVGAFFPPISMEHEDIAWTSPYTITPSAINSWVGEELRTVGVEGTIEQVTDDQQWSFSTAVFWANDPAGTLLAWRGWALHDHKVGLFSNVPLPALPVIGPSGKLSDQEQQAEPFQELDGRPGFYTAFRWEESNIGELRLLYYNNLGDEVTLENGQYAWHTRFANIGARLYEFAGMELTTQAMWGNTRMGRVNGVDVDFLAAYVMFFKRFKRDHVALRFDYFKV